MNKRHTACVITDLNVALETAFRSVNAEFRQIIQFLLLVWQPSNTYYFLLELFEPPHDKTNKVAVRAAKTQISLGIRPVWSESLLSAWRHLGSLATHWAQSEDSDQTGRMPRLIRVFARRTCHFVGFVTMRFICYWNIFSIHTCIS